MFRKSELEVVSINWVNIALALTLGVGVAGCGSNSASNSTDNSATASSANSSSGGASKGAVQLLNVSYDPTRELYADYNQAFAKYWQGKAGQTVTIKQSHGGSGKQARSVIDGLEADVVTLGIASDIDSLADNKLLAEDWDKRLPNNATPYTSTIIFLVRKGNPKNIKDWDDLVKSGISVITPSPKTSSGGQWNYLAAYGYALQKNNKDEAKAKAFIGQLYKNVPVLDSGARGATTTFVEHGLGDVLIAWENEAELAVKELGPDKVEIVVPPTSILAEPPVAVVDKIAAKHGTTQVAQEYLKYLYSPEGQEIIAKHYYRPRLAAVAARYADKFPKIKLFTFEDTFKDWRETRKKHFGDGGIFDQIYQPH